MTANDLVIYAMLICLGGAALTWILARAKPLAGFISLVATVASSAMVLYGAIGVLRDGPAEALTLWSALGSSLRFHVDGLSAVFLCLVAFIALLASVYSVSYLKHYEGAPVGKYHPYFLLFVAGMYGIVTVTDLMLFFFVFWQLMTLPSFALVRFEYTKRENVRAANRYLIMMEISCLLVMLGAGLLGAGGAAPGSAEGLARFDFESISARVPALLSESGALVTLALFCFLVGFGIKAGMWPFGQMWLPEAHPAAPSPVSALLSGVMIKTGVYGLMRSFLWLVPSSASYPSEAWGMLIAVLGTITLFIGTVQALKQEQSKRLLAFHSIGQIGYILLGLGACLALVRGGAEDQSVLALASMGFYGALFHTLNHGMFKSLLFFNAGSMLYATGTQDLNRMGGLMKYMPLTGIATLVASFSIAGVPLFNGFASKWSIYVSTVLGTPEAGYLGVCATVAILTSVLTLASFMKFFGVSFLSRTSRLVKERAGAAGRLEVGWTMQIPQLVLGFCCIFFGLVPVAAYYIIVKALAHSPGGLTMALWQSPYLVNSEGWLTPGPGGGAILATNVITLVLALLWILARALSALGGATRRAAPSWLCGYAREAEVHRYHAHNLYGEVKRYFRWVGGAPAGSKESSAPGSDHH